VVAGEDPLVIVCFGSINLDLIVPVARLPGPGETVLGGDCRMEPGGKGANQAVAAARDGAGVVMAGAVGRDALAAPALSGLEASGADLGRVARADGATGCALIAVDGGGRNQIVVAPGANAAVRAAQVEDALLGPATTLLLQMELPEPETAALIRRARRAGARIVLNLAPALPLAADALRMVDVLVANETEAAWLAGRLGAGEDAAALSAASGTTVIRTLGAAGAEAAGLIVPAPAVTATDTTAAGDCFTGVLAAALDRGEALEAAMRRAVVAASLACTRSGSQRSLPTRAETDAALAH